MRWTCAFILMLSALCVVTAQADAAGDSYLCVADLMTGFRMDPTSKEWRATNFHANLKFVVARPTSLPPGVQATWLVKEPGNDLPVATCENDFSAAGQLFCSGFYTINFSRKNLRFVLTSTWGYWDDDNTNELFKEGKNMPAMAIGKCTSF